MFPILQWKAGSTAIFHAVYLGTTPQLGPAELVAPRLPVSMTTFYYAPGVLPGVTYYWRVDETEKDLVTVITGDVWVFTVQATTAYLPNPADGSNTVPVTSNLTWLPGQGAAKHHVFLSDSQAAVTDGTADADKGMVTDPNYAPAELLPATTYFWRVDEILLDSSVVPGLLWSFTTLLPVDDFESYTDEVTGRIFQTWIDGWGYTEPAPGNPGNGTGATVGYTDAPFAEQKVVHGGKQSMPMDYNNINSPFYSEAERSWDSPQDWTINGVDTLTLYVQGQARDFDIPKAATAPVIDGKPDDVWAQASVHPIKTMISGAEPTNPADASGQFRVLYDSDNLYALVDMNDEKLINDSANSWQDDSIEFYVDGDNTKGAPPLSGHARQYTFGWTTTDIQGTNTAITGAGLAQVDTPTGWRLEIKLPWQALIESGAPVGKLIGVDCFYNDDDDGADTRETQIAWHSIISDDWQTPRDWGTGLVAPPQTTSGADALYIAIRDGANHTAVVTYPSPDVLKANAWVEWKIPLSAFSDAGVNLATVRKMSIGVGDRANPIKGGSGSLYFDDIYLTRPAPAKE